MATPAIIVREIAKRTTAGLRLAFIVPDRPADLQPYVCYAKDDAQKAEWLRKATAQGWKLAD